ncbi:MAG TPA: 2,3-bisphosphoglycerate-dependent phosphoglycerate mutase [Candidatus Saccharimonadales bacterium]|nr:2,3-bisphosphoglycerate-dependent phosphoglycerate mutase [Candidatus Saccharimonadales bacterium]
MSNLLLIRHGESEYNANELFTGLHNPPLTQRGRVQASQMAASIKDLKPDIAYTSLLTRAKDTLDIIMVDNGWDKVPLKEDAALNERDYGKFSGLQHAEIIKRYGDAQYIKFRRGWNEPIPDGETLKMVYKRVVLYFEVQILPELRKGNNVLIVAHGNTLRALIKHLDGLDDLQIETLEMPLQEVVIYNYEVRIAAKQVRKTEQPSLPYVTANTTYLKE